MQNSSSKFDFDVRTTKDFSNLDGLSAHQKIRLASERNEEERHFFTVLFRR